MAKQNDETTIKYPHRFTVLLTEDQNEMLREIKYKLNVGKGEAVRRALEYFIKEKGYREGSDDE